MYSLPELFGFGPYAQNRHTWRWSRDPQARLADGPSIDVGHKAFQQAPRCQKSGCGSYAASWRVEYPALLATEKRLEFL